MKNFKYKKSLYLVKVLSLTSLLAISQVIASQDEIDDFATIPTIASVMSATDEEAFYPTELTHAQVQTLKNGFVHYQSVSITADDPVKLSNVMMPNKRFISNWWCANQLAKRINIFVTENEDSQVSKAIYEFDNGTKFTVTRCRQDSDPVEATEGSTGLKASIINIGTHIISMVAKQAINRYCSPMVELHHAIESFAKAHNYSTVTHMIADIVRQGKSFKLPARLNLIKAADEKAEESTAIIVAETLESTAIVAAEAPVVYNDLHEISQACGNLLSMVTFLPELREAFTLYAQETGFPTVTHFMANCKEVFEMDKVASEAKKVQMIESITCKIVEKFCPYGVGGFVVKGSQFFAQNVLNETSLTAYILKNHVLTQNDAPVLALTAPEPEAATVIDSVTTNADLLD